MMLPVIEPEILDAQILIIKLSKQWKTLWQSSGTGKVPRFEYFKLWRQYFEAGRGYHDLFHVDSCLAEFAEVKIFAQKPQELERAIWYHDYVYDSKAKDNEYQSAIIQYETARRCGISEESAAYSSDLILFTKHEPGIIPETIDGKIILDIDLSIFGKEEAEFDKYEKGIAKEYAWAVKEYGQEFYNTRRAAVLESFRSRSQIYLTEHFHDKYEAKARQNLERSIRTLLK